LYRELFLCSYSLASAGDVCWAKPNHAFSYCQHIGRFFFGPAWHPARPVAAVGGASRRACFARRSPGSPECFSETALFKGFAKTETGACAIGGELARLRHADRNALRGRANAPCRKVHRGAPVSRRTSRFARKCANFSGARRPHCGVGRSCWASSTTHRSSSLGCFDAPCRDRRRGAPDVLRCRFAAAPTCVRESVRVQRRHGAADCESPHRHFPN